MTMLIFSFVIYPITLWSLIGISVASSRTQTAPFIHLWAQAKKSEQ
ncbi:hypothetical protein COI_2717 [Mannheimia haemolytica serotype A2 str. OVINE]|nr:hypothetical protein COI_2717 [Mannheimia haemolytica serotype A2 str. OVINE]